MSHYLRTVSILCADSRSTYQTISGVEVYDKQRDAWTFDGGTPIVAHPPCRAWSAYCGHQAKPEPGEKELAMQCVEWLRQCGGVLEQPAHSRLFAATRMPLPGDGAVDGMFSIAVKQSWWGHPVQKNTWLCLSGIKDYELPFVLRNEIGDREKWNKMSKRKRAATPLLMAQWLVDLARGSVAAVDRLHAT